MIWHSEWRAGCPPHWWSRQHQLPFRMAGRMPAPLVEQATSATIHLWLKKTPLQASDNKFLKTWLRANKPPYPLGKQDF